MCFWHWSLWWVYSREIVEWVTAVFGMGSTKPKRICSAKVQDSRINSFAICSEMDSSCVHFDRNYFQWKRTNIHLHTSTQVKKNAYWCIYQYTVEISGKERNKKQTPIFSLKSSFIIKTVMLKEILRENNCNLPKFYHCNMFSIFILVIC